MTKQLFLRSMLVALGLSAVLAIASIYAGGSLAGRLLLTTLFASLACALMLPHAPREAGARLDLLQRTVLGFILVAFALGTLTVWDVDLIRPGGSDDLAVLWLMVGVPALGVAYPGLRSRRRTDRSLALSERVAFLGAACAMAACLASMLLLGSGGMWMETQFLIGWICVAGALVGSASALGRRAASSERFAPPPPATAVDRAIGATGMLAALGWSASATLAVAIDQVARQTGAPDRSMVVWPIAIGCAGLALPCAIWCALGLSRVTGIARFLRHLSAGAALMLGVLATLVAALAALDERYVLRGGSVIELMSALAVVSMSSLIAAAVMMRLHRGRAVASDPIESIDWNCPRCSTHARIGAGEHSCVGCGLAVRIAFRDDRCPACAYDLRGQPADAPNCPECGRVRQLPAE
jgi:hypothetical protein